MLGVSARGTSYANERVHEGLLLGEKEEAATCAANGEARSRLVGSRRPGGADTTTEAMETTAHCSIPNPRPSLAERSGASGTSAHPTPSWPVRSTHTTVTTSWKNAKETGSIAHLF